MIGCFYQKSSVFSHFSTPFNILPFFLINPTCLEKTYLVAYRYRWIFNGIVIMRNTKKYNFSLTSASLRLPEMVKIAQAVKENSDFDYTKEVGRGNQNTGKRLFLEIRKRVNALTPQQLEIFLQGDLVSQKQLAFLAICKSFAFVRDFVGEVLREKVLVYDYEVRDGEYLSFFRRKLELYPEMEDLSDESRYKIKQVLFKILEQSGIIDSVKNKNIQFQILDPKIINVIVDDHPEWLKIFFMSDIDIAYAAA